MIHFECLCGKPLRTEDELAGQKIRCPSCGREMVAPAPQEHGTADAARYSRSAIVSLCLGIVSFVCFLFTGIPAIIFGVLPFVLLMFLAVVVICVFPQIATALPDAVMGAVPGRS